MSDISVTLHKKFADDLLNLAALLKLWAKSEERLIKAQKRIGERLRTEAVRRVPVDTSRLKQSILHNTYKQADDIITEVGTNVKTYPVFVEFGTEHIAGGRVLALGQGEITDEEAIKEWPAKNERMLNIERDAAGRLREKGTGKFVSRQSQEQMPWLRPAFYSIKQWAIEQQARALVPPGRRGAA